CEKGTRRGFRPMKILGAMMILLLSAASAAAQCYKEVRKPQKPRTVARFDWNAAGRRWQVALIWQTMEASDTSEEGAEGVLGVRDDLKHPKIGDLELYRLAPNRCDLRITPQLSTVKLMGHDFLLVTLPDSHSHNGDSGVVVAVMYSIDVKGKLAQ